MHVAFLSWRDTTHTEGGGAEFFVEGLGRELVRRGHRVTIFCADHPGAPRKETRGGVELRRRGGRLTVYPRGLIWLARHRRCIDVVVDVVNGLPFAARLVAPDRSIALIHHVHAEQWRIIYPGWRGRVGWFVESRLVPRLYRGRPYVTVSEATASELRELPSAPSSLSVVRNALDEPAPPLLPEAPTPRLVCVSRLVPHKHLEHAFALVAALAPDFPDLTLDVVGDGWWREELREAAEHSGVADRIVFHGHVSNEERDRLVATAWVLVHPSVKEGWGLVVSEAGRLETPAVAYRSAGGVRESIDDGNTGLLADDFAGLVDATRRLLQHPEERRRMGVRAHEKASALTWEASAEAFEDVVRSSRAAQSP